MPNEENNAVAMEAMDEMNEGCVEVVKPANNLVGRIVSGFIGFVAGVAGTIAVIAIHKKSEAKKEQTQTPEPMKKEDDDELEDVDFSEFDETEE